jgi:hypothetical protein
MPYILSPEQKVVVDALLCKEASSTKYFDIVSAIQSISKACTLALTEGKKVLIHVPDEPTRKMLQSLFETLGLQDLSIDLSEKQSIPEEDLVKLRSTLKKQNNTDAVVDYVLSQKRASRLEAKIAAFYNAMDTKVFTDTPFRDFVTNSIYKKHKGSPIHIKYAYTKKELDYSASEYYKAKKEIIDASKIYHKQYELYDHLLLFKEDLWTDLSDASILNIKTQLQSFKTESTLLLKDFKATINLLQKDANRKTSETFAELENKFLSHEEACIIHGINKSSQADSIEGILSIFKKRDTQSANKVYIAAFDELSALIKNISQEWYDELDAPTAAMITYDYILEFIKTNRAKVAHYEENIHKKLKSSLHRINKINTSSQEVIALDKRLEALIQKMNNSELFDLNLEHNILSFLKQVELCERIAEYIEKCYILVYASSDYLEWKYFYNSTGNTFRYIFDSLKNLPRNEWIESFENWYEQQIQANILGEKTISEHLLESYYTQANITNQYEVAALIANLHAQRISSAELLKGTSKELYNTLFKKKQLPLTSWNNTALMNRPFLQSFFPLHLSDTFSYASEYDLVISFSKKNEEQNSKLHCFSPIEREDIEKIAEKKDNFLYLNDYNYNRPLAQLSSTDKLKASKKLAKYILSLNQNIKIYQLKSANIISLLPIHDDSYLEQELDKINVKVIDTHGVLYDRLTESILFTERKPFLIIKDGLINSELHEHILWQLKMIHLFKDVGYEIISLNTTDQLEDNERQFSSIIQQLEGTNRDSLEKQVSESSELEQLPEQV